MGKMQRATIQLSKSTYRAKTGTCTLIYTGHRVAASEQPKALSSTSTNPPTSLLMFQHSELSTNSVMNASLRRNYSKQPRWLCVGAGHGLVAVHTVPCIRSSPLKFPRQPKLVNSSARVRSSFEANVSGSKISTCKLESVLSPSMACHS